MTWSDPPHLTYQLPNLFDVFFRAAEQGVRFAMWKVASCYYEGRFVARSPTNALLWMEKAADAGLPIAKRELAKLLITACGTAADFERGFHLFVEAATDCDSEAQFEAGRCLVHGTGTHADREAGLTYFQTSAINGNKRAESFLAYLLAVDFGMPIDVRQSLDRLRHAAMAGSSDAWYALGVLYRNGFASVSDLHLAREAFRTAAMQGHLAARLALALNVTRGEIEGFLPLRGVEEILALARSKFVPAQVALGQLYEDGTVCPRDFALAQFWYGHAAEMGSGSALLRLGKLVRPEPATIDNVLKAVEHFEAARAAGVFEAITELSTLAQGTKGIVDEETSHRLTVAGAEAGDSTAMVDLGAHYLYDLEQPEIGLFWFAAAADAGHATGHFGLGYEFLHGIITAKDLTQAQAFLADAAILGDATAAEYLAAMFFSGKGPIKNLDEAARLFHWAANRGNANAAHSLCEMLRFGIGIPANHEDAARLSALAQKTSNRNSVTPATDAPCGRVISFPYKKD